MNAKMCLSVVLDLARTAPETIPAPVQGDIKLQKEPVKILMNARKIDVHLGYAPIH